MLDVSVFVASGKTIEINRLCCCRNGIILLLTLQLLNFKNKSLIWFQEHLIMVD